MWRKRREQTPASRFTKADLERVETGQRDLGTKAERLLELGFGLGGFGILWGFITTISSLSQVLEGGWGWARGAGAGVIIAGASVAAIALLTAKSKRSNKDVTTTTRALASVLGKGRRSAQEALTRATDSATRDVVASVLDDLLRLEDEERLIEADRAVSGQGVETLLDPGSDFGKRWHAVLERASVMADVLSELSDALAEQEAARAAAQEVTWAETADEEVARLAEVPLSVELAKEATLAARAQALALEELKEGTSGMLVRPSESTGHGGTAKELEA
jgi:hypothetical protein